MYDAMLKALTRLRHHAPPRDDRGQTAVEYLGIIVVVAAIIIAIAGTDIGSSIMDAITEKISAITGGGGG
ncbi:Flp family type IVb pilin [Streptomyces sp. CC208A]|uniref:Flp family type IVb pilin n=1 Tax=Streptomyces sp. CC208A TaxID=3044573 RepID=UPI0024A9C873|nr:Flp family type IVb pilin [Streptomyces sp. CC208A]